MERLRLIILILPAFVFIVSSAGTGCGILDKNGRSKQSSEPKTEETQTEGMSEDDPEEYNDFSGEMTMDSLSFSVDSTERDEEAATKSQN
jgi:flagellar basal body-associated protein FliL